MIDFSGRYEELVMKGSPNKKYFAVAADRKYCKNCSPGKSSKETWKNFSIMCSINRKGIYKAEWARNGFQSYRWKLLIRIPRTRDISKNDDFVFLVSIRFIDFNYSPCSFSYTLQQSAPRILITIFRVHFHEIFFTPLLWFCALRDANL